MFFKRVCLVLVLLLFSAALAEEAPRLLIVSSPDGAPVPLYEAADPASPVLAWYFPGTAVTLLPEGTPRLSAVRIGSGSGQLTGYMDAEVLEAPETAAPALMADTVSASGGAVMGLEEGGLLLPFGTPLLILGYGQGFVHVQAQGLSGFVSDLALSSFTAPAAPAEAPSPSPMPEFSATPLPTFTPEPALLIQDYELPSHPRGNDQDFVLITGTDLEVGEAETSSGQSGEALSLFKDTQEAQDGASR